MSDLPMHDCLFEVAVYRVSEDAWLADVAPRVEQWVEGHLRGYPEEGREAERLHVTIVAQQHVRPHGWQYNEIVGWARLMRDGADVIKAYTWRVQRDRIRQGFTPFPFEGGVTWKVVEVWIDDRTANEEIYRELFVVGVEGLGYSSWQQRGGRRGAERPRSRCSPQCAPIRG
jgi:hypothetical protein